MRRRRTGICPTGKTGFDSKKAAQKSRPHTSGDRLRVYFCPYCKYYHFTSKVLNLEKRVRYKRKRNLPVLLTLE